MIDKNDNAPEFVKEVYKFSVDETVDVGETLFTKVALFDADSGINALVRLTCDAEASPEACDTFEIRGQVLILYNFME